MNGVLFAIMIGVFAVLAMVVIQSILDNPNS
jgi:hypothetical protein